MLWAVKSVLEVMILDQPLEHNCKRICEVDREPVEVQELVEDQDQAV
jgi:hypothetical protein